MTYAHLEKQLVLTLTDDSLPTSSADRAALKASVRSTVIVVSHVRAADLEAAALDSLNAGVNSGP